MDKGEPKMNLLLTLLTVAGPVRFTVNPQEHSCDSFLQHLQQIGDITYQMPFTYFKTVQVIGYTCSQLTLT